jgi:hypothetical protein
MSIKKDSLCLGSHSDPGELITLGTSALCPMPLTNAKVSGPFIWPSGYVMGRTIQGLVSHLLPLLFHSQTQKIHTLWEEIKIKWNGHTWVDMTSAVIYQAPMTVI